MPTRMRLTGINLLKALEAPEMKNFYQIFTEQRYGKKEQLFLPDSEKDQVFLIKSGRVRVFLSYEDKEFTLSILEKGDIFTTHTRAYTQALNKEVEILVAETDKFSEKLALYPQFLIIMVGVLGDLLKNSITIIDGLVFRETNFRLAQFLLQAAEDKGIEKDEEILLELGLNVEEIATVLGTARQTVSMLLNDMYKSGVLRKEGRQRIVIKDLQALREIIGD